MAEFTTTHYGLPSPTSAGEVKLGATDIKELAEKLDTLLFEHRFGSFKSSVIATEQERTNVAYGTLTTPDEVEVELPANGLIAIGYQATWKETVLEAASAAIFLNGVQLKFAPVGVGSVPQENRAFIGKASKVETFFPLATGATGLGSLNNAGNAGEFATNYTGDVTTGQILGGPREAATPIFTGGPCHVFAAAGTYKITVQFKASSGTVKAKGRKLWAWVVA